MNSKFGNLIRKLRKFLHLERTIIAEWLRILENSPGDCLLEKQVNAVNRPEGGVSEDQKFAAKLTHSKTKV